MRATSGPALEKLLAFLGLDWDDACLQFHTQAKNQQNGQAAQHTRDQPARAVITQREGSTGSSIQNVLP